MRLHSLRSSVFLLVLSLCLSSVAKAEKVNSDSSGYHVQAGDVLIVSVWDEPELQAEVVVLPDMTISFPLAGHVSVSGLGVSQIGELLTSKISVFVPQAYVHVAVTQVRGSRYYVLGKVNRPGEYARDGTLTVLQALSVAGGLNSFADENAIKVIRATEAGQISLDVDYEALLKGKALDGNLSLHPGDLVVVP